MTIEASRTAELDVGGIVRNAYRKAGLLNEHQSLSQVRMAEGIGQLQNVCRELDTQGVHARSVAFEDITCEPGEANYTLPASIIDGVGTPVYVPADEDVEEPDSPSHMRFVRRDEWIRLSSKSQESSRPSIVFIDRSGETLVARVWQKPEEAGFIRLPVHRLRADVTLSTSTVDYEQFWVMYFEYAVAHEVALMGTVDLASVMYLAQQKASYLSMARGGAGEKPQQRMVMGHRTPWSR